MSSTKFLERRRKARQRLRQQQQQREEQADNDIHDEFEFDDDSNRDEFEFEAFDHSRIQTKRIKPAENRSRSPTSFSSLVRYSSKVYSDGGGKVTKRKRKLTTSSTSSEESKPRSRIGSKVPPSHLESSLLTAVGGNGAYKAESLSSSSSSSSSLSTTTASVREGKKGDDSVSISPEQRSAHSPASQNNQSRILKQPLLTDFLRPDSDDSKGDVGKQMTKVPVREKMKAVDGDTEKEDEKSSEGRSSGSGHTSIDEGQNDNSTAATSTETKDNAERPNSHATATTTTSQTATATTTKTAVANAVPSRFGAFGKKRLPSVLKKRTTLEERAETLKSPRPVVRFSLSPSKSTPDTSASSSNNQNSVSIRTNSSKDLSSTAGSSAGQIPTPVSLKSTDTHPSENSRRREPFSPVNTTTPSSSSTPSFSSSRLPQSSSSTSSFSSTSSRVKSFDSTLTNLPTSECTNPLPLNEHNEKQRGRKRQRHDGENENQQQHNRGHGGQSSSSSSLGPLKRLKRGNSLPHKSQAPAIKNRGDSFTFAEDTTDGASAVTVSSSQLSRSSSLSSTERGPTRSKRQPATRRQRFGRIHEEDDEDWAFGLEPNQETTMTVTTTGNHQEAASMGTDSLSSGSEWDIPVVTNVRGAGTDAFAVQDAGSYRMLKDDCAYLCSTILTAVGRNQGEPKHGKDLQDDASTVQSQSSSQTVHLRRFTDLTAEAACDLAVMLSSSRTRAGLLLPVDNENKNDTDKYDQDNAKQKQRRSSSGGDDILHAVLDVLACAPRIDPLSKDDVGGARDLDAGNRRDSHNDSQQDVLSCSGNQSVSSSVVSGLGGLVGGAQQLPNNKKMGRTRSGRRKLAAVGRSASIENGADDNGSMSAASTTHQTVGLGVGTSSVNNHTYNHVAERALGCLAHFVSLDCTMTAPLSASISAVATPGARRRVRKSMLEHGGCLRGLARLIVADRTVGEILAPNQQDYVKGNSRARSLVAPTDGPPLYVETNDEYDDVGESQRSSLSISSFGSFDMAPFLQEDGDEGHEEPLSQSSICSEMEGVDPTKSGRRSRRARRSKRPRTGEDSSFSLDPISENTNAVDDTFDHIDPNNDIDGATVVNSQQSTMEFRSEELSVGQLQQQTTTENDAISCAALPRLEAKLEKIASASSFSDDPTIDECTAAEPCKLCPRSCRGIDKTIDPGMLALRALHRILIGKEVNDSDENADGDDVEHKEDAEADAGDEQESGNNPLVMTNEMLARSSAIPLVAQAMSWTLAALTIVIQQSLERNDAATCSADRQTADDAFAFDERGDSDDKVEKGTKTPSPVKITNCCPSCMGHLRGRVTDLAVIVDRACCFHDENRQQLCAIPNGQHNDSLPVGLVMFAVSVALPPHGDEAPFSHFLLMDDVCDVLLSALRTLTSLTHENEVAAQQFLTMFTLETNVACSMTGIEGIMKLLFALVSLQQAEEGSTAGGRGTTTLRHHWYDMTNFCLNILTNTLESECAAAIRREIYSIEWQDRKPLASEILLPRKRQFALSWLSKWVASQTDSYRRAMMKGTFGKVTERKSEDVASPSKLALRRIDSKTGNERDLKKSEEESLVVAGNGFIFLACLMREECGDGQASQSSCTSQTTAKIRKRILSEMPTDLSILVNSCGSMEEKGLDLMIRTLKAFCNFYHYSLGELSVAVVTPVVKIISDLEAIGKEESDGSDSLHASKIQADGGEKLGSPLGSYPC